MLSEKDKLAEHGVKVNVLVRTSFEKDFLKAAQAGGRTWDLFVFVYFLSQLQHLRPLGYCAPLGEKLIVVSAFLSSCCLILEPKGLMHRSCTKPKCKRAPKKSAPVKAFELLNDGIFNLAKPKMFYDLSTCHLWVD